MWCAGRFESGTTSSGLSSICIPPMESKRGCSLKFMVTWSQSTNRVLIGVRNSHERGQRSEDRSQRSEGCAGRARTGAMPALQRFRLNHSAGSGYYRLPGVRRVREGGQPVRSNGGTALSGQKSEVRGQRSEVQTQDSSQNKRQPIQSSAKGVATDNAKKDAPRRYCQRAGCLKALPTDSRADAKFCSASCRWQNYAGGHVTISIADLCAEFGDNAMDRLQERNNHAD